MVAAPDHQCRPRPFRLRAVATSRGRSPALQCRIIGAGLDKQPPLPPRSVPHSSWRPRPTSSPPAASPASIPVVSTALSIPVSRRKPRSIATGRPPAPDHRCRQQLPVTTALPTRSVAASRQPPLQPRINDTDHHAFRPGQSQAAVDRQSPKAAVNHQPFSPKSSIMMQPAQTIILPSPRFHPGYSLILSANRCPPPICYLLVGGYQPFDSGQSPQGGASRGRPLALQH